MLKNLRDRILSMLEDQTESKTGSVAKKQVVTNMQNTVETTISASANILNSFLETASKFIKNKSDRLVKAIESKIPEKSESEKIALAEDAQAKKFESEEQLSFRFEQERGGP